jgi:signal peptidase
VIRRGLRLLELAAGVVLVVAWVVTLRPTSLGGPATYIVVRGDSMLPAIHSGDLVVLQAGSDYRPGDAIGYRVPDGEVGEGQVVVHRIVAGNGRSGFTMEGDNNPAPDPWLPHGGDVAGRIWLLLPGLGRAIVVAHQPAVAGALAVSLLVMVVLARRPKGRQAPRPTPGPSVRPAGPGLRLRKRPRGV